MLVDGPGADTGEWPLHTVVLDAGVQFHNYIAASDFT